MTKMFKDLPAYFWNVHKAKNELRNDAKEINKSSGLTGHDLEKKNKEAMRAIRRETGPQLIERQQRQNQQLEAIKKPPAPPPPTH